MKQALIFISIVIWILLLWGVWTNYSARIELKYLLRNAMNEKYFLEDSFNNLFATDTIDIENVRLNHKGKSIALPNAVTYPCFVVYLPSTQEDICNSCIEYALNEALNNLKRFSENKNICIISVGANPEIKERLYKKTCYVVDKALINAPQANLPYYFVVDTQGVIKDLFSPNFLFKKHVATYWKNLKLKYPWIDSDELK